MSLFNNLLGCACSPPQQEDDSSHRDNLYNNVDRDIRNNSDRIKRLESKVSMRFDTLETKLEIKMEFMSNKIDNILMILNHTSSPATSYQSIQR